jgi:hypothetical protein
LDDFEFSPGILARARDPRNARRDSKEATTLFERAVAADSKAAAACLRPHHLTIDTVQVATGQTGADPCRVVPLSVEGGSLVSP